MALPVYTTLPQKVWHYSYLSFCGLVLFFLVAPLIAVIPLSFTSSAFLSFTPEMLALDPEGFSLRWYRMLIGDCSDALITTVCSDKWKIGAINSLFIAVFATIVATSLGILASLALSRPEMPFRKAIMALMISPLIVPLIITASGMFLFFAKFQLVGTYLGLILAHTVLGIPFVVITVTATAQGPWYFYAVGDSFGLSKPGPNPVVSPPTPSTYSGSPGANRLLQKRYSSSRKLQGHWPQHRPRLKPAHQDSARLHSYWNRTRTRTRTRTTRSLPYLSKLQARWTIRNMCRLP